MTALVEYILRVRFEEPTPAPSAGESGEAMAQLLGEFEAAALETEIVSRVVLAGPDAPSRVRCASMSPDRTRHFATTNRWTIRTPDGETVTVCSAACALGWFCQALPADLEQANAEKGDTAASRGQHCPGRQYHLVFPTGDTAQCGGGVSSPPS